MGQRVNHKALYPKVLEMRQRQRKTFTEIGNALGMNYNAVSSLYDRAVLAKEGFAPTDGISRERAKVLGL